MKIPIFNKLALFSGFKKPNTPKNNVIANIKNNCIPLPIKEHNNILFLEGARKTSSDNCFQSLLYKLSKFETFILYLLMSLEIFLMKIEPTFNPKNNIKQLEIIIPIQRIFDPDLL